MPMIEMDETQYAEVRSVYDMVQGMMKNPKSRKLVLQARKEADPDASIPEIDAVAPVRAEISSFQEELAATRKELAQDKADREEAKRLSGLTNQWDKGRSRLRADGYTDEGITAIEDLMEKEGIANHEAGAAYYDRLHPQPEPVAPSSGRHGFFDAPSKDDTMKMLYEGNDEGFLNTVIGETLSEMRSGGRRR